MTATATIQAPRPYVVVWDVEEDKGKSIDSTEVIACDADGAYWDGLFRLGCRLYPDYLRYTVTKGAKPDRLESYEHTDGWLIGEKAKAVYTNPRVYAADEWMAYLERVTYLGDAPAPATA